MPKAGQLYIAKATIHFNNFVFSQPWLPGKKLDLTK